MFYIHKIQKSPFFTTIKSKPEKQIETEGVQHSCRSNEQQLLSTKATDNEEKIQRTKGGRDLDIELRHEPSFQKHDEQTLNAKFQLKRKTNECNFTCKLMDIQTE